MATGPTMPDFGRWTSNGGDPSLNDINRIDRFLDALAPSSPCTRPIPPRPNWRTCWPAGATTMRDADRRAVTCTHATRRSRLRVLSGRRRTPHVAGRGRVPPLRRCCASAVSARPCSAPAPVTRCTGCAPSLFGEQRQTRDDSVVLACADRDAAGAAADRQGQWEGAQDKLGRSRTTVASVNEVEQKQELVAQWNTLTVKVDAQDSAATLPPPGAPLPVLPEPCRCCRRARTSTPRPSETTLDDVIVGDHARRRATTSEHSTSSRRRPRPRRAHRPTTTASSVDADATTPSQPPTTTTAVAAATAPTTTTLRRRRAAPCRPRRRRSRPTRRRRDGTQSAAPASTRAGRHPRRWRRSHRRSAGAAARADLRRGASPRPAPRRRRLRRPSRPPSAAPHPKRPRRSRARRTCRRRRRSEPLTAGLSATVSDTRRTPTRPR